MQREGEIQILEDRLGYGCLMEVVVLDRYRWGGRELLEDYDFCDRRVGRRENRRALFARKSILCIYYVFTCFA